MRARLGKSITEVPIEGFKKVNDCIKHLEDLSFEIDELARLTSKNVYTVLVDFLQLVWPIFQSCVSIGPLNSLEINEISLKESSRSWRLSARIRC